MNTMIPRGFLKRWHLTALLSVLALVVIVGTPMGLVADNGGGDGELEADFILSPALTDADKVLCDHDFADAEAEIEIKEKNGMTRVKIEVEDAVPNEFYTAWLKVDGSPITGIGATPLAPTTELDDLEDADGMTNIVNGFFTDDDGDGKLKVKLDFPMSEGVYPFPSGDVAIGDTPFTIRLASHCSDHVGHGLLPGTHERTFDVSLDLSLLMSEDDEDDDDDDDSGGDDDDDGDSQEDDD